MHTSMIKIERQRLGVAFAEGEGGCGFGRVGEAVELGEVECAVAVCDVAEDTAGADRGELLIITDQPDTRTTMKSELDRCIEGEGVGHPGFVDDDQGRRPDRSSPPGQLAVLEGPGELGKGVGTNAGFFAQDGGRGRRRGEADDLAAVLGPGQGEGAHRGGLPGAGRRNRQLHPCPGGAHLPDQSCLSGVEGGAVRRQLQQRQVNRRCVDDYSVVLAGGGDEALFGVDDPLRGVAVGAGDGVDRRPVGPPQLGGLLDAIHRRGQGDRALIKNFGDEEVDQRVRLLGGELDGADLPFGFGADVPHLPGRPAALEQRHDAVGSLGDPAGVGTLHRRRGCCQRRCDHRIDSAATAENLGGFGHPYPALFGFGAWFVLRVTGFQGGLLGQMQGLDRSRWPTVVGLELDGELAAPGIDAGPAGRPALVQARVDANDLPDRPLARAGAGTFGEPHPQPVAQMAFEGGVVGLRCRHFRLEQHPPIDGQPAPVEGLDLVRNRDVGVQIRVAGPAVAVSERRRDQPANVDLPDSLRPGPGEQRILLDEPQRIAHGGLMRAFDDRRHGRVGDRPQGGHRLHRRERQVITGDRAGPGA